MEIEQQKLHDDAYRWNVVDTLMRDNGDDIMRYCCSRLGEELGEEVTQSVFVTAWEKLPKFQPIAPIRTWLFGIARNKCQQAFRNRARRRRIDHAFQDDIRRQAHAEAPQGLEASAINEAQLARFRHSLAQLREAERIVLNLRYRQELTVAEIADALGKSETAVRKRLDRAKQRLREMIKSASEGPE